MSRSHRVCRLIPKGLALLCMLALAPHSFAQGKNKMEPDLARVKEIAAMLRDERGTFGRPASDREAWDPLAQTETMRDYVQSLESDLTRPVVPMTEEEFREGVRTGSRVIWYGLDRRVGGRLKGLVLSECCENKGRFVPKIEEVLEGIFLEKTWIATVRKSTATRNWDGEAHNIDLGSSRRTWAVALTDYLLADRLSPAMREKIRKELEHRTFGPYRRMITGEQKPDSWITCTNNWNAVCLAGVTGAALTYFDSKDERAFFLAAAEKHSKNFLKGFPLDGYCTEGLSYYSYGFSHYLDLSEAAWQATDGQLDLFNVPQMRNIALFGARTEIFNGVYPSIADCPPNARPNRMMMDYTSRRLGLGLKQWETDSLRERIAGTIAQTLMHAFPNSSTLHPASEVRSEGIGRRSFFDNAGILVCRPAPGSDTRLAACLKGGHNAEHHNHNDVGTFIVVVDAEAPIADAGAEVYTHQTFSKDRYKSDALNSYGHSTPLVAGTMQSKGRKAEAVVLRSDFTDTVDTFALDLKACYDVPDFRKLERTFVYSREGDGSLTVTDEVAYASPQAFEVGLITLGNCRITGPDTVLFVGKESAAVAKVECDAGPVKLRSETLKADLRIPVKARRIGIALAQPAPSARITVRIVPVEHPDGRSLDRIHNGDFEKGEAGWKFATKNRMGQVVSDRAASGEKSLKIVDNSDKDGSNCTSSRMCAKPGGTYAIRGKVFPVSGSPESLGVYTRFYDASDKMIRQVREERLKSIVLTGGSSKQWQPFSKTFQCPEGAHFMRIWVHSMGTSQVTAYLDDLEIVEAGAAGGR